MNAEAFTVFAALAATVLQSPVQSLTFVLILREQNRHKVNL